MNRTVEVEGRNVSLTNLDKVLWPETGTTKAELIADYVVVAPVLLPHLEGRPLTLRRFPDGVALRPRVEELGLEPVPKASGSLGLHVHAAVETGTDTKRLAREVAEALAEERPDEVVAEMKRAARAGRVFVDWLQNDVTRQTVAPYSLRGLPHATVAAPVRWDEVERAAAGDAGALVFTRGGMLERIEGEGDLFEALRRRVALGRSQTPVLVKRNVCRKRHNVFRASDSEALLL